MISSPHVGVDARFRALRRIDATTNVRPGLSETTRAVVGERQGDVADERRRRRLGPASTAERRVVVVVVDAVSKRLDGFALATILILLGDVQIVVDGE